jgi:ABC-type transport system involved in multi-copper enzyme maturation permease subunit
VRKIFGIARYTFIEILRNRVWYVLILFSGILILSTLLLGTLGGEQGVRMITDLGLASIEIIALLSTVFAAVTLVLEEMESRTLYLILTRPVARSVFVIGRFLGLVAIMTCAYLLMAAELAALLSSVHATLDRPYALSLLFSWEKIVVITAVAFVFSLFSTSTASAATFTFFFWIMGHLSTEVLYLARKTSQPLVIALCKIFYYLFPNFAIMNIRDVPMEMYRPGWLWSAGGYGLCYTGVCLLLTAVLFRKKEF